MTTFLLLLKYFFGISTLYFTSKSFFVSNETFTSLQFLSTFYTTGCSTINRAGPVRLEITVIFFTKLPWPGDNKGTFRSSC